MASNTNETPVVKYDVKQIRKKWFLEVRGKLSRLQFLSNAQDVSIEENVIFADESMYQITLGDTDDIVITEIVDASHITFGDKTSDNVSEDNTRSLDQNTASITVTLSNDHIDADSDFTVPNVENAEEDSYISDLELTESDEDPELERGHEEYVEPLEAEHTETNTSTVSNDKKVKLKLGKPLSILKRIGNMISRRTASSEQHSIQKLETTVPVEQRSHAHVEIETRGSVGDDVALRITSTCSTSDDVSADGPCCNQKEPCSDVRPIAHLRDIEVERESVKLLEKIGRGSAGDVYKGKIRGNFGASAVKEVKPHHMSLSADDFLIRMNAIANLRHTNIVQFLGVCANTEPVWIMSELMDNGALLDYIRDDNTRSVILFSNLTDIAAQIANGMAYLERENFAHGNLRAANILLDNHNNAKVADYGLYQLTEGLCENSIMELLPHRRVMKWLAPEVFEVGSGRSLSYMYTIKSDVWSYGVLLCELITFGMVPYPGMSGLETLVRVKTGWRMPRPMPTVSQVECPDMYYDMMLQCWNKIQECRPTFDYLHNFFDDYAVCTEDSRTTIEQLLHSSQA